MSAICEGPECERPAEKRGMCDAHYKQQREGRPPSPLRTPPVSDAERQRMRDEDPCPCDGERCDMGTADPRHGTTNGYDNRGCRCPACYAARAERDARYRADNREQIAEREARYRAANREQVAEQQARCIAAYKARTDEQVAADRARLRPDGMKDCRKCQESLPLSAFSNDRRRADGLRGTCRACDNLRLLTDELLAAWEERGLYACVYCGLPFAEVDHMHPVNLDGVDDPENLAPACRTCNSSKQDSKQLAWVDKKAAILRHNHEEHP